MKVLIICILIMGTIFFVAKNRTVFKPLRSSLTAVAASRTNDTIRFAIQIQPILVTHCSPCHFPGGKMYVKMPFDKGATIVDHEVALLRRIKDEKENALIQKFIDEQKK